MRPDAKTVETYRNMDSAVLVRDNLDNIIEDFDRLTCELDATNPQIANFYFSSFVLGMMNAMNPQSEYNKSFKAPNGTV